MKTAFAIIVLFALAGCSPTPPGGTSLASATARAAGESTSGAEAPASGVSAPLPATTATVPAADATSVLTQYHWQLADAVDSTGHRIDALFARADRPLQLDFDARGVSISNTCNRMRGSYSIAGGKLTLGNLASTLMACNDPALAALDSAAGKYLQGTFTLGMDVHGKQPRLALSAASGGRLTFAGTPTDATRYGGEGETTFLEVAPQTRPCRAPADSQCLYVRELHYDAHGIKQGQPGDWHVLAQDIEGYTHQPGTRNVLRVKRYRVANAPADASFAAYVLDMVVETGLPPRAS
jgi:heat shock protein HslJ